MSVPLNIPVFIYQCKNNIKVNLKWNPPPKNTQSTYLTWELKVQTPSVKAVIYLSNKGIIQLTEQPLYLLMLILNSIPMPYKYNIPTSGTTQVIAYL